MAIIGGLSDKNFSYNCKNDKKKFLWLLSRDLVPAQLVAMAPNRYHFKATEIIDFRSLYAIF